MADDITKRMLKLADEGCCKPPSRSANVIKEGVAEIERLRKELAERDEG